VAVTSFWVARISTRRPTSRGSQLTQELVEDRLAARVAVELDLLKDADARERRLVLKQALDLGTMGSSLDGRFARGR
jgi:hypothetical protein